VIIILISDACLAKRDPVRKEADPPRDHQQKRKRQQLAKEVFPVNPFFVKPIFYYKIPIIVSGLSMQTILEQIYSLRFAIANIFHLCTRCLGQYPSLTHK
jgi:hypothetical protein